MTRPSNDTICPCLSLPPIRAWPTNGFGGSYYNYQFPVPVYNSQANDVFTTVSWSDIDLFYNVNALNAIESAVSLGICAVTLLNVMILTPSPKRKMLIHAFICLALTFQIIRDAVQLAIATVSIQASSYLFLTFDNEATRLSPNTDALITVGQVSSCLAFIFVQACFFVQGRALMTWLHLHHRVLYGAILTGLVSGAVVALAFRIGIAVFQIRDPLTSERSATFDVFRRGTLIAYGSSIGSWSLVFFTSAVSIIITRRQTLLVGGSIYDIALNLIAIIGLESFIIPILLCIMELVPVRWTVHKPEQLIIPVVLFLLPMGSLFLTFHAAEKTAIRPRQVGTRTKRTTEPEEDSANLLMSMPTHAAIQLQVSK